MKPNDAGLPLPGREHICSLCGKRIEGIEIYGDVAQPMCWDCYAMVNSQWSDLYYGLGPHEHQYDEEGNIIIGATKFLDEQPENFTPDPDAPRLGVWEMPRLLGWR